MLIYYKKLRETLGISQKQLASLVGVHPMTVSKWERGTAHPNSFQFGLLVQLVEASIKVSNPNIPWCAAAVASEIMEEESSRGVIYCLYKFLSIAYDGE